VATGGVRIDRALSTARIARDLETLAGPDFTCSQEAICRYAYTDAYRNTVDFIRAQLEQLGFDVSDDPVGTLVGRNRPDGEPVFGVGSHCDSNRNGGRYDGTLGVLSALELCRLNHELGLGLPLQLISFLEEEGSGFGVGLLGSRIIAQSTTEEELRRIRSLDDGRTFWEHAEAAGYSPERWREAAHVLDDLIGWIELHIEQARVLQDTGHRLGIVHAIAGIAWADVTVHGRGDHAGATPMDFRRDPLTVTAECVLELERLARAAGAGTVATVGEVDVSPGLINAIPERVRFSLDVRSADPDELRRVIDDTAAFAAQAAVERGMEVEFAERQLVAPTPLDGGVVAALEGSAREIGEPFLSMVSGAGHDTMCIAGRVPSAMVFVPCKDGISHHPDEHARPEDAALAVEVMLNAIRRLFAVR
jgi:hydantoinase/carbamoylase family amidase